MSETVKKGIAPILARCLEWLLGLTVGTIFIGHVVNRLTSPVPLNPLWNRISGFAASGYGGNFVTAGIFIFALSLVLFGGLVYVVLNSSILAKAGGLFIALGSAPMALIAVFPTYTPRGEIIATDDSPLGWIASSLSRELTASMSDHLHNVSSAIAFAVVLAGIILVSIALLRTRRLRAGGRSGILLAPMLIIFLKMAYNGVSYNGTWQRTAFVLLLLWIWFVTAILGKEVRAQETGGSLI